MISFAIICIVLISSRGVASVEEGNEKNPCNNACEDWETCSFSQLENQYQCICIGYDCGPDPCNQNPCENGGTCSISKDSYFCSCVEPYVGKNCTDVLYSCDKECENGGNCVRNGDKMECECRELYSGNSCEIYIELETTTTTVNNITTVANSTLLDFLDFCYKTPCQNGGTCELKSGGYKCICSPQYSGVNCEKEPTITTATSRKTNEPTTIIATSSTTNEPTTTTATSRTTSEPTTTTATSSTTNEPITTTATSRTTNEPTTTTATSRTANEPTTTTATSRTTNELTTTTSTSRTTNDILDFCYEEPCENGGTCELESGGYKCICSPQYSGDNCEKEPTTTTSTSRTTSEPTAITATSRTASDPTNTTASRTTSESTTTARTTHSFNTTTTSKVTTIDYDFCISNPCLNNGSCIIIDNSVRCNCTYPFIGELCDTDLSEKNQSSSNSIVYACTGSAGAIIIVFLIGFSILWHLKRVKQKKKDSYFHNADSSSMESGNSRTYII